MKHGVFGAMVVVALLSFGFAFGGVSNASGPANHEFLSLTPLPPRLPTNSSGVSTFSALVVSINDASGNPVVASNGTQVFLSSSQSAVLKVQPSVTIPAGAQYAIASVTTTATPGNTTVTAVSLGFESASASVLTFIARGYPTQLQLFPLPSTFAAGQPSTASYVIVVEDAAGLPARTVASAAVQLTSSNTTIAQVGGTQVPVNKTVAYGTLTTSGKPGVVSITASSQGLVSSSTLVSVVGGAGKAVKLSLSAPANLPADGGSYNALMVMLLDGQSRPAVAGSLVQVLLTSSRTDVASMQQAIAIPPGKSFVTLAMTTSPASGSSLITASALNFTASTVGVSTVSIPPTKLAMYLSDGRALVSATANLLDFVIQLQDSRGFPAVARSPASVILSFSNNSLLQSPLTMTIAKGADLVYARIPLTQGTRGTFTAISNGLQSVSVSFSAAALPVAHTLGASSTLIHTNQTATLYLSVQYQGNPVPGVEVVWSASGGSVVPSPTRTDGTGSTSAVYHPSSPGVFTVKAVVKDPVVGSFNSTASIVVVTYPQKTAPTLLSQIMSYIYYIVAAAAAAVVVVIVVWRRRRGTVTEDDSFAIEEPEPGSAAFDPRASLT